MSKRESFLAPQAHLLPQVLGTIRINSQLKSGAEFFRTLAERMNADPELLRRNWFRWRAVSDAPDGRSSLARSDTLERLFKAASDLGWLDSADSRVAALLEVIPRQRAKAQRTRQIEDKRRTRKLERLVDQMLLLGAADPWHDLSWPITMHLVIGERVVRDLREKLLDTPSSSSASSSVRDDLLAGTVLPLITAVREAAQAPLVAFEREVHALQARELEAFASSTAQDADAEPVVNTGGAPL